MNFVSKKTLWVKLKCLRINIGQHKLSVLAIILKLVLRLQCQKKSLKLSAFFKKAAAFANHDLGVLPVEKRDLIAKACDEILANKLDDQFPLVIWQTGPRHTIKYEC